MWSVFIDNVSTLNGTDLINNPFGTVFKPFTDFFEILLGEGGGNVFFLVPVLVLAFGLWTKNPEKPIAPIVFVIGASAIMGAGNYFVHAPVVAMICFILTALGLTSLFLNVIWHRGG